MLDLVDSFPHCGPQPVSSPFRKDILLPQNFQTPEAFAGVHGVHPSQPGGCKESILNNDSGMMIIIEASCYSLDDQEGLAEKVIVFNGGTACER